MTDKAMTPGLLKRFGSNRRGIAALEFALIFPLMASLFLGSVEVGLAINTNKNVGKVASSVADLITQTDIVSTADLSAIAQIGDAILTPYDVTQPVITMVGIQIDDTATPKARVAWSRRYNDGSMSEPFSVGAEINIPANLMIRDTFVVMAKAELEYIPVVGYVSHQNGVSPNIDMGETYYLRPRLSDTVFCSNC